MSSKKLLYFIINKPHGILSQFSDEANNPGLGSLYRLPKDVYPVGRLDLDSEGLLLLTNDKSLNDKLLNPKNKHYRTYFVEVEGVPDQEALNLLRNGLEINLKGTIYKTSPSQTESISDFIIVEREPPVNRIKHPITSWLKISLIEGKNRQVRRMTSKVGHPTLRLIRISIEDLELGEIPSGGIVQISQKVVYKKLKLDYSM